MSNVIPFNNNQEDDEPCTCELCELTEEYTMYLKDAESHEDFQDIVRELIEESKMIGIKQVLMAQVENNVRILDEMHGYGEDGELN